MNMSCIAYVLLIYTTNINTYMCIYKMNNTVFIFVSMCGTISLGLTFLIKCFWHDCSFTLKVRNNVERFYVPLIKFPPMVTSWETILQYTFRLLALTHNDRQCFYHIAMPHLFILTHSLLNTGLTTVKFYGKVHFYNSVISVMLAE